jgi:XTP/dITP diphosphohydrolase
MRPCSQVKTIMSLVFVTRNKDKSQEMSALLGISIESVDLQLAEIQDIDVAKVANHKASLAYAQIKRPLFVDDTGIYIDAWGGFPGPFIAHIVHSGGPELLLSMMVGTADRKAKFVSAISYHDGKNIHTFTGEVAGTIAREAMGRFGFGIDSIFVPDGHSGSYATMTNAEKNTVSHRSKAVVKLKKYLESNL